MSANEGISRVSEHGHAPLLVRKGIKGLATGQPPSDLFVRYQRRKKLDKWLVRASQAALLIIFLVAWEVMARTHLVNPMLTSYPSALWPTFLQLLHSSSLAQQGNLVHHTLITLEEVAGSFIVSMALGILVAVMLWWSSFLYRVLDPYLVVANAMPKIALVPIFYIWLGDTLSIYGIAIAIAGFITTLMIYAGFRQTDPGKIKLMRALGANKWQVFIKLVLPCNVPTITSALKANIGLVLVGVIVGEFQSSRAGLGYLIVYGSQIFKMNLVMTAIMVLAAISTVMYLLVLALEVMVLRRRRQSAGR
jgi:NitT/TauT family transport system permease protein